MKSRLLLLWILFWLTGPAAFAGGLRIILDYRFDDGYFSKHPERKIPLEYAARLWEKVLLTPKVIPAGTELSVRTGFTTDQQTTVEFPQDVPGFMVFIYAFDFAKGVDENGDPDPEDAKAFSTYYRKGLPIGYLAINTNADRSWFFDTTPEDEYDVPVKSHYDLITTGVHELGHVLGFLSEREKSIVKSFGKEDDRFVGPKTLQVNDGSPVPLQFKGYHIRGDWWKADELPLPPLDRHVMHTHDPVQGYRQIMTKIDLAIMDDSGWDVDYEAIPPYPYRITEDSRKSDLAGNFGITSEKTDPVGVWLFDQEESLCSAIVGNPLRYSPPKGQSGSPKDLFLEEEIRVPPGGFFYCVPRMKPSGKGGSDCNRYTLVFDIRVPRNDIYHCLLNTNPDNANDGDWFINAKGCFGVESSGYSSKKLSRNTWYRLGMVVDADRKVRKYFIDGRFSHEVRDVGMDGRFAINSDRNSKPFCLFFADDDGEEAAIDVRRIILYETPLSDAQMEDLGDCDQTSFGL